MHETKTDKRSLITAQYQRLMNSIRSKRWQWLAGLAICAVVYGYIGLRLWRDWRTLDLSMFQLRPGPLFFSWAAHGIGTLIAISTWMLLLRQMGYALPLRRHIKVYTTSNLVRRLPGFVWWVVGRAYMYDHDGVSKLETSAGSLLEMILISAGATAVALLTMLLSFGTPQAVNPLVLAGLLIALGALLQPRLFALIRRRLTLAADLPSISWRRLAFWLINEMLVVTLGGLALYFMLAAIYPVTAVAALGAIQGWALMVVSGMLLVWLPIDFGISNGVLVLILSVFLPAPVAFVVVVIWRCWVAVCELLWGVFGLLLPASTSESSH
jgi:hypothetical protein